VPRTRPPYPEEFKREAIELVRLTGASPARGHPLPPRTKRRSAAEALCTREQCCSLPASNPEGAKGEALRPISRAAWR
jgi:hypothetical protein